MIINKYRNISPGKIIMYIDVFIIGCSYFIGEDTVIDPTAKIATIIYGYVVMGVNSTRLIWYLLDRCNRYNSLYFLKNTRMWRIPLPGFTTRCYRGGLSGMVYGRGA